MLLYSVYTDPQVSKAEKNKLIQLFFNYKIVNKLRTCLQVNSMHIILHLNV